MDTLIIAMKNKSPGNKKWGERRELNPRMSEPQPDVLTTSPRSP